MINRAELKNMAKAQIKDHIWMLLVCTLVVSAAMSVAVAIPGLGSVASIFVTPPLTAGVTLIYMNLTRGEAPKIEKIFSQFNSTYFTQVIMDLLISLYVVLGLLLLIVPGVIFSIQYCFCFNIYIDNPEMKASDILKASKEMTKGHKMDIFMLDLSFLGWGLLVLITCGIAAIWVAPYMQATFTNLYYQLKGNQYASTSYTDPTQA